MGLCPSGGLLPGARGSIRQLGFGGASWCWVRACFMGQPLHTAPSPDFSHFKIKVFLLRRGVAGSLECTYLQKWFSFSSASPCLFLCGLFLWGFFCLFVRRPFFLLDLIDPPPFNSAFAGRAWNPAWL